jgi:hypothetical protein
VSESFWCQSFTYSLLPLGKIFMPAFSLARTSSISTSLVPEAFPSVNIFLVPALFWYQHFSGARSTSGVSIFLVPSHILVPALFWCQHFSGARSTSGVSIFLVPALFWCQHFSGARSTSGVSIFLVPAPFWCQPFSGARTLPVSALFWCQPYSGVSPIL